MTKSEPVITKLYKNKIVVKFFPDSHIYNVDGVRKTGVTTILGIIDRSRPMMSWATDVYRDYLMKIIGERPINPDDIFAGSVLYEEKKKEAGDIGKDIHKWVEQYAKGEKPEMPEQREVQIGVTSFLQWVEENKVKFISSERPVYSKRHDYIGTLDFEAKVNGKLCLVDVKSSNALYNSFELQTAAYVMADEEESGKKYQGRWLIRVAKETEREYLKRMDGKNAVRQLKGKDQFEYGPYKVFEARFLDNKNLARDQKAFLSAKALFEWNKETSNFQAS